MAPLSEDLDRLRRALTEAHGSVTQASKMLGATKPYVMVLVSRHGLNEWCRTLREANGLPHTGRHPKKRTIVFIDLRTPPTPPNEPR